MFPYKHPFKSITLKVPNGEGEGQNLNDEGVDVVLTQRSLSISAETLLCLWKCDARGLSPRHTPPLPPPPRLPPVRLPVVAAVSPSLSSKRLPSRVSLLLPPPPPLLLPPTPPPPPPPPPPPSSPSLLPWPPAWPLEMPRLEREGKETMVGCMNLKWEVFRLCAHWCKEKHGKSWWQGLFFWGGGRGSEAVYKVNTYLWLYNGVTRKVILPNRADTTFGEILTSNKNRLHVLGA